MNAEQLIKFFYGGNQYLQKHKAAVDALNVFPVPDGDTGTNMSLTMQAAVKEIDAQFKDVGQVAKAVAKGSLMGARGNSGVILSQLFRGLAQNMEGEEIKSDQLADALQSAVHMAYKAVMRPVEGTILTVAKACAAGAREAANQGMNSLEVMEAALRHGEIALAKTPDQLMALKEAGVVDAGGKGLLVIFSGGIGAVKGKEIDFQALAQQPAKPVPAAVVDEATLKYRYCTEFILKGANLDGDLLRNTYQPLGDSVLVVGSQSMLKVHIHTNNPGKVLELAIKLGTIHDFKMDNMAEQHRNIITENNQLVENKPLAVVAVAVGQGLTELLRNLGADKIVSGGQSMNPSTEDLVAAIKEAAAEKVLVLPNNSNIILAAQQAAKVVDKVVEVVPSKTFPQGIAAMLAFNADQTLAENHLSMTESLQLVTSGEVTYAVRDSSTNGKEIKAGDILGLKNGKIEIVGADIDQVVVDLVSTLSHEDAELLTLYYGETVQREQAEALGMLIGERKPHLEVEIHYGGQPLYYYIISVE